MEVLQPGNHHWQWLLQGRKRQWICRSLLLVVSLRVRSLLPHSVQLLLIQQVLL